MDIRNHLKESTQIKHLNVENTPLFKKISNKTITVPEYIQLLNKLYSYISQCEHMILATQFNDLIREREKAHLLHEDLLNLLADNVVAQKSNPVPTLVTKLDILGYLYVIEGSTLGGQVITKLMGDHLKLSPENGLRYFHGYGRDTKNKWDQFCVLLNNSCHQNEINCVIKSANMTFDTLHSVLINS